MLPISDEPEMGADGLTGGPMLRARHGRIPEIRPGADRDHRGRDRARDGSRQHDAWRLAAHLAEADAHARAAAIRRHHRHHADHLDTREIEPASKARTTRTMKPVRESRRAAPW